MPTVSETIAIGRNVLQEQLDAVNRKIAAIDADREVWAKHRLDVMAKLEQIDRTMTDNAADVAAIDAKITAAEPSINIIDKV